MARPNLGSLRRRSTTLLTALTFLVLAVTGVLAFLRPFSIGIVGLHALMGFIFIGLVALHVLNNKRPLGSYLRSRTLWFALTITTALTFLFSLQPPPVKSVLGLSGNLGPAMERFEMNDDGMIFQYSPSNDYRMALTVKTGSSYKLETPPRIAIWLENQGAYHIKTLLKPEHAEALPYWTFKRQGWEKARRDAENETDAISTPTPNGSFDPADYILPAAPGSSTPYKLLIEINQAHDPHGDIPDQASLVYSVEIDNLQPTTFQLLDLVGYPKQENQNGKETWSLYFVDEGFGSALHLIDSALLTIQRP
ncbi:DUF2271 domain-containing protein [Akkermansiaceae bacterium]|nr:DUF2271 domain-containing protein [Akkermansiaceae bacterium]